MIESIINQLDCFIFSKDASGKFIFCNEKFAEAAGVDSPKNMIGKTDKDVIWHSQADFFRDGDIEVMRDGAFFNRFEKQIQPKGTRDILVTKSPLIDSSGFCKGVVGSYIDISSLPIQQPESGEFSADGERLYLGNHFPNEYFTRQELSVFKSLLTGSSTQRISSELKLNIGIVENAVTSIKQKLQCETSEQIIITATEYGLNHLGFNLQTPSNLLSKINPQEIESLFKNNSAFCKLTISNHDVLLNKKESTYLLYIIKGLTCKQIAEFVSRSPRTVEYHIDNLRYKLNCDKKSQLATAAIQAGFLDNF